VHEKLVLIDPDAGIDQRASARFADGKADAQGAAHVLLAAARAAGYPARYVAGHP
jgi:transglutaminase-like putative cysteine protease